MTMPETHSMVSLYLFEYLCDLCSTPLEFIGGDYNHPIHTCPKCHHTLVLKHIYPHARDGLNQPQETQEYTDEMDKLRRLFLGDKYTHDGQDG